MKAVRKGIKRRNKGAAHADIVDLVTTTEEEDDGTSISDADSEVAYLYTTNAGSPLHEVFEVGAAHRAVSLLPALAPVAVVPTLAAVAVVVLQALPPFRVIIRDSFDDIDHPARLPIRFRDNKDLRLIEEPENTYGDPLAVRVNDAWGISVGMVAAGNNAQRESRQRVLTMLSNGALYTAHWMFGHGGPNCIIQPL
jgi:hypothetical protein